MADGFTVDIVGAKELRARLRALEPRLARKVFRTSLRKASADLRKEIRQAAPKRSGTLRRAIYTRLSSRKGLIRAGVWIRHGKKFQGEGKKNKDAFYWRFVELGTKFIPARPFIRPAWDRLRHSVLDSITRRLREELDSLNR